MRVKDWQLGEDREMRLQKSNRISSFMRMIVSPFLALLWILIWGIAWFTALNEEKKSYERRRKS